MSDRAVGVGSAADEDQVGCPLKAQVAQAEHKESALQLATPADLAKALEVDSRRLNYLLYAKRLRKHYTNFSIPKSDGSQRLISVPPPHLLWLQRQLLSLLAGAYQPKQCIHGFCEGRSILTNAEMHLGARFVVNVDLKDFFPSIHFGRVEGVFRASPFSLPPEVATVAAQICCRDDGILPQGAATSPLISNLVCRQLDNAMLEFAKRFRLRYSRYADDLTFSTRQSRLPVELIKASETQPGDELRELVEKQSFELHPRKCYVRTKSRRQEVTGITVNAFPNVPRRFVRSIDGALYAWESFGLEQAQALWEDRHATWRQGQKLKNVLRGRINYLAMVRGKDNFLVRRLTRRFNRLIGLENGIALSSLKNAEASAMTGSPSVPRRCSLIVLREGLG